jgi:hypothetical protein
MKRKEGNIMRLFGKKAVQWGIEKWEWVKLGLQRLLQ